MIMEGKDEKIRKLMRGGIVNDACHLDAELNPR